MKKNFFKKLSFVMALAMIVSVIAPASGAFAATAKPKLSTTATKYLFLGTDKDEYDFNISNKKTGWKYSWESADETIATVNAKNGLTTAKKCGTTKISVAITDADGEDVTELTGTVVVKDNIKSLTIKAPATTFDVATDYDFNRSFVTVSGSTKKTTAVTKWSVDKTTATISSTGVFNATAADTYVITARAFQSNAKYTAWLALNDAAATTNVLATATYTVKVVAAMVKAEQVDLDTFKVTFNTAVTDAATKLALVNLVGTTEVSNTLKAVTMSADNKVATVDLYSKFTEKSTYVIKYPDMANVQFVAATSEVADVKSMAITSTTAQIGIDNTVDVALYNADGVNIADTDLLNRLTLASTSTASSVSARVLRMFTLADTTTVTATFHTWTYDTTTGTETGNLTATGVITCVAQEEDKATSITAYTVQKTFDNFTTINHNVAVGDNNYKLFVKLLIDKKNTTDTGSTNNSIDLTTGTAGFQMSSSNTSVLIVDDAGNLFPVATGTASVIVKFKEVVMGAVNVTVGTRREVSVVTVDTNGFSLSNTTSFSNQKVVTVAVKDQFGATVDGANYSVAIETTSTPVNAVVAYAQSSQTNAAGTSTPAKYTFAGTTLIPAVGPYTAATKGTYVYKISVTDTVSKKVVPVYVTMTVVEPAANATVNNYQVEANATTYNMKLNEASGDDNCNVTLNIYGYSSTGVKLSTVAVGGNITLKVKDPNGVETTNATGTYALITADNTIVSGASIAKKSPVGTYTVQAVSGASTVIATTYFKVEDTQATPTLVINKSVVKLTDTPSVANNQDITGAVKACITLTLNGVDVATSIEPLVAGVDYTGVAGTYYVNYIHYAEPITGSTLKIDHKIAINRTITIE